MKTESKTDVQIIQELLAVHTSRTDITDKLKEAGEPAKETLHKAASQSKQFIKELMNELSNYGDAVVGTVDRENEYQQSCKDLVADIDAIKPADVNTRFLSLESILKKYYEEIIITNDGLPASLSNLLQAQVDQLS